MSYVIIYVILFLCSFLVVCRKLPCTRAIVVICAWLMVMLCVIYFPQIIFVFGDFVFGHFFSHSFSLSLFCSVNTQNELLKYNIPISTDSLHVRNIQHDVVIRWWFFVVVVLFSKNRVERLKTIKHCNDDERKTVAALMNQHKRPSMKKETRRTKMK